MATYLADKYREMKVTMINFGAPRIGNEAFKIWTETELSNLSAWRYVNRKDFIPRAIPGFDHAGHLFAIYDKKARVYYNQIGNEQGYKGVRRSWYCEYIMFSTEFLIKFDCMNTCHDAICLVSSIFLHIFISFAFFLLSDWHPNSCIFNQSA
jgi:hypothetical protein